MLHKYDQSHPNYQLLLHGGGCSIDGGTASPCTAATFFASARRCGKFCSGYNPQNVCTVECALIIEKRKHLYRIEYRKTIRAFI